jgi:hypothetical protein
MLQAELTCDAVREAGVLHHLVSYKQAKIKSTQKGSVLAVGQNLAVVDVVLVFLRQPQSSRVHNDTSITIL